MIWNGVEYQMEVSSVLLILLKISVILCVGWGIHFSLLRQNPRWRILLWRSVLCGILLIPLVSVVIPTYELSIPRITAFNQRFLGSKMPGALFSTEMGSQIVPPAGSLSPAEMTEPAPKLTERKPAASHTSDLFTGIARHPFVLLALVWSLVAIFLAARLLPSLVWVHRTIKASVPVPDSVRDVWRKVARDFGYFRYIDLRSSPRLATPFLCGLRSPMIILPEWMIDRKYTKDLPGVFIHELVHLQSKDMWWTTAMQWCRVILWFHPLVWRLRAAHDSACEQVCDAVAADYVGNTEAYSQTLARVALDLATRPPAYGGIAMAHKSRIRRRLEFLAGGIATFPLGRSRIAMFLLLAGVSVVGIAGMQPVAATDQAVSNTMAELDSTGDGDLTRTIASAKEVNTTTESSGEASPKATFRKITIPTNPGNGILSPDGTKLAFESEGSIWVVPVHGKVDPDISGKPVRLTESIGALNSYNSLAWSADGKWIAFNVNDSYRMYVIPSSGGEAREIPVKRVIGSLPYDRRISLSPDGNVLAYTSRENGQSYIFTIPVNAGEATKLTGSNTLMPAFSPDGKKIAYNKVHFKTSVSPEAFPSIESNELWVIPSTGGSPVRVCEIPIAARGPVWSRDGRMIAFLVSYAITDLCKELWIVCVSNDGNLIGNPVKYELPSETYQLLANWTEDDKIGIFFESLVDAIYTVSSSGGKATEVTPKGYTNHPHWSPDGTRIFFRWDGGAIGYVPSDGGEVTVVLKPEETRVFEILPGGGNAISPDGEKIVFSGWGASGVDLWTLPVEGGKPTRLTPYNTTEGYPCYACWSPDGKSVAFVRSRKDGEKKVQNVFVVSEEGGEVRQLTSDEDKVFESTIEFSPDGKYIAYFSEDKTINLKPLDGGEPIVVAEVEEVHRHHELSWSPDGKNIAYTANGKIWAVSVDDGEKRGVETGLDLKAYNIDWSPDGRTIAFAATTVTEAEPELWLMENFLP